VGRGRDIFVACDINTTKKKVWGKSRDPGGKTNKTHHRCVSGTGLRGTKEDLEAREKGGKEG